MEILSIIKHFLKDSTQQVKFHRHVIKIDNLDSGQQGVLESINELYELFPDKTSITPAELKAYIKQKNPAREISYVADIIDSSEQQDIGVEITQHLMEAVVERHMATKSMAISSPIVSNQKSGGWATGIEAALEEYYDLVGMQDRADSLQDCDMTFEEAMEFRASDSGIKWPLAVLNKCIGGVEPSLGLVIARPDTGKTSFVLNCIAYFAHQLNGTEHQILYCGNEEGIMGLKARFGVSLLGVQTEWAEANANAFGTQVSHRNGDCVRFHGGVRSTRDVETLIKRYNPIVTVADQIAKFKIPGNKEEGPAALASIYGKFRGFGQDYSTMVIGVAQADIKSGQWIGMDNINGSKTDVPGEVDWGIGVGLIDEPGLEYQRFVNIFKNKMKYGRKGRGEATFTPETCRYKDK